MADPTLPSQPQQPVETPPQTAASSPVAEDEKLFATIGYLSFLFVVPLIVKPKSAYCKFHAKQSMILFLISIIVLIILAVIPWFGSLLTLTLFAVYILAIYRAYKGELWNIPIVSNFAGKMDVETLYSKAGLAVSSISGLKEKAEGLAQKASQAAQALGKQEEEKPQQPPAPQQPAQQQTPENKTPEAK